MSDIVESLRSLRFIHLPQLSSEAADEIERLRSSHATAVQRLAYEISRLRITDAEREAVEYYVGTGGPESVDRTLVALLQRLK